MLISRADGLAASSRALTDTEHARKDAREIGQAATLMYALFQTSFTHTRCGNYATATALVDESNLVDARESAACRCNIRLLKT